MTEKQKIINAFKDLDFKKLYNLLDDNKSYMDVSKKTFLNALQKEVKQLEGLKSYKTVEEGICNSCNKGCKAYKFKAAYQPSLNLFFEEKDNSVSDIYLCNDLKVKSSNGDDWNIYFKFYEEEKVNFSPSINYSINLQRIEKAIDEFKKLGISGLVPIQEVVNWFEKMDLLAKKLHLNDPFMTKQYKEYKKIDSLYKEVSHLVHNYKKVDLAKKVLDKHNKIDVNDEKGIVKWLLENEKKYFFSLKKTNKWKNTGILILETKPNLVIDCSKFLESFLLNDIYHNHHNDIMDKYKPTKEHYEQKGGSVNYSLETFLKLHNKYLDLL